jgi:hypothetical protein
MDFPDQDEPINNDVHTLFVGLDSTWICHLNPNPLLSPLSGSVSRPTQSTTGRETLRTSASYNTVRHLGVHRCDPSHAVVEESEDIDSPGRQLYDELLESIRETEMTRKGTEA